MKERDSDNSMNRRTFLKLAAATAISGPALFSSACAETQNVKKRDDVTDQAEKPLMNYKKLGRTNFMSSRLVFGCGAALVGGRAVRLLDRAYEAGINHYDVGSNLVYKGSERYLAPFLKSHRDKVWVASKAPVPIRVKSEELITPSKARNAARYWARLMDASLKDLQTDYVNAYYLMAVDSPSLVRSEEMYQAFLNAKKAGKVEYFGISTHKNAENVLKAAIETGWYDLAMMGITPVGWYDWDTKNLVPGSPTLNRLQGLLQKARDKGIGLIGIKTVRFMAPVWAGGRENPRAFDEVYGEKLMESPLNPFQRAYAYVLNHGLDVVNADMQNFKHLEENISAVTASQKYFS